MPKYAVTISRDSWYEVEAETEDAAIDAALSGEYPEVGGETTRVVATMENDSAQS